MNLGFIRSVGAFKYLWRRSLIGLRQALSGDFIKLRLPTGLDFILPPESFLARDAFVTGCDLDWGSEALFFEHLDKAGDFLDVGANIGYYSLYGAPCVRRVLSFEPDVRNHRALERNAAQAPNVHIHKVALSSQSGEVCLDVSEESDVSKVVEPTDGARSGTVCVQAKTLDEVVAENADVRVSGIKLDTEGHELPILRGGLETIRRDQPLIVTELQRPAGEALEACRELAAFAGSIDYLPFAFVQKKAGGLRAPIYRLARLATEADYAASGTKMIFLVPRRLEAAFTLALKRHA